uniref:NADH:ubiquinone reductase (non-electrogenic) n=1 Tax=Nelumbo nucifera TaxID=4432 RepID=A0A822XTQ6_NELNU|nr:TPA_asm: hypothetical protein HUJ06_022291 [Nelumbo nucifera]
MALSRLARTHSKQSGKAISNYLNETGILCEAAPARKYYFYSVSNFADSGNLKHLSGLGKIDLLVFGSRGIRVTPKYQYPSAERILEVSDSEYGNPRLPGLEATRPGEKPRVVVLGTLEFRSVAEPVSQIQTALATSPNSYFYLASCLGIDTDKHEVYCETVGSVGLAHQPYRFKVAYDKLVIATGADPLTFNIKGVKEHAFFLREVNHAQEIRRKLLLNLMISENPGISDEEKKRLLHCVVIGGGPTGVEFSGELSDFIMKDVRERYSHAKDDIRVTLIEANEILSSFDVGLRQYAIKHLTKSGVRLMRGVVKEVHDKKIVLSDGTDVPYGLLVWSTGVGPSEFVKSLNIPKSTGGRIGVNEWLQVPSVEDVYALGDCAGFLEETGKQVLPALAQVAEREGKYLVGMINRIGQQNGGRAFCSKGITLGEPFVYRHLGSMASVGRYKALVDLRQSKDAKGVSHAGFVSWMIWRSAYLTRVISWRNRFYVAVNWATTFVFGRDNSRIG